MKHGYIRVAAATPDVKVADPQFNRENIVRLIREGIERNTKIMVFPELCLTAYTCADLFGQDALLTKAKEELKVIVKETEGSDYLFLSDCHGKETENFIIRLPQYKTAEYLDSYQRQIFLIILSFTNCGILNQETKSLL